MSEKLQLELGKRYVRRDGDVSGPLKHHNDTTYPFMDPEHGLSYTPDGHFCGTSERAEDFVSLFVEPDPPVPKQHSVAELHLRLDWIKKALTAAQEAPTAAFYYKPVGGVEWLPAERTTDPVALATLAFLVLQADEVAAPARTRMSGTEILAILPALVKFGDAVDPILLPEASAISFDRAEIGLCGRTFDAFRFFDHGRYSTDSGRTWNRFYRVGPPTNSLPAKEVA